MENIENTSPLYTAIKTIIEQARSKAYAAVNFAMVEAYWNIGRKIVEENGLNMVIKS